MNLVFKNTNETADENAPKLYKDARVNDGTLFFIEFSNRGALVDFDPKKGITDLADDTQVRGSEITTEPEIMLAPEAPSPTLSADRGLEMTYMGNAQREYTSGIRIKGVGKYLFENQPNCVFIFWLRRIDVENTTTSRVLRLGQSAGGLAYAVTVNSVAPSGSGANVSVSLAGKSGAVNHNSAGDKSIQIAVEFVDENTANNVYINGQLVGPSTGTAVGKFEAPLEDDILAIGGILPNGTFNSSTMVYEAAMHDLGVAGMTAGEVVKLDYDYTNGIGQFEGLPTRRPYANLPLEG